MEILDLILRRVDQIARDLKEHIDEENILFRALNKELESLRISQALHKQRNGWINGGIAAIVAVLVSWAGAIMGKNS